MTDRHYDLLVVGAGAAGLTAAREGVRRGARTALVEAAEPGGDCTFTGCVPSKTLLDAAGIGERFEEAMARVRETVAQIAATEDRATLADEGIVVVHGWATLRSSTRLDVEGTALTTDRLVLATGARPTVPPIPGLQAIDPLTSETLFSLDAMPRRLVVLGGGAIGAEMGQAFARLGSEVTILEAEDRLLPREEPEASAVVATALGGDGIAVMVGDPVAEVRSTSTGHVLCTGGGREVTVDAVLVSVGRQPNTAGLGLEEAGIALDERGHIRTRSDLRTTAKGVWAIGDVTGRMPFTHAGARMGWIAARNALAATARFLPARFDPSAIPAVTYTDPEVAHVGITEAEAGPKARVAHLPFDRVDRARTSGRTEGFVKLIAGPRRGLGNLAGGRVLGATIVGPRAGEMIHEVALAMQTGMFTGRLAQTVHAYPTWSLAVQQAAGQFLFPVDGLEARPAHVGEPGP
jgi:pyruvate/2-oxoglutarate dehydrogenase complex dihydrolipoamide dehydrogenase (E3) component